MNAFELGKFSQKVYGFKQAAAKVSRIYSGFGTVEAGLYASGVVAPFVGPAVATVVGAGIVGYGAKQVYEGLKSAF